MQLSRLQENSVEIDLTEVFNPIKEAVSRLAEAQMTIVARQISAEIAQRVDADVQNLTRPHRSRQSPSRRRPR